MTHRLPPGQFALTESLDDRIRAISGAPARVGDLAHPILAYVGALGGLAQPIGDWARALGLGFDLGPVLGRCRIDLPGRLRTSQVYEVRAEVGEIQRKPSRRFGEADHAPFAISLCRSQGAVSILSFTMVTPVRA